MAVGGPGPAAALGTAGCFVLQLWLVLRTNTFSGEAETPACTIAAPCEVATTLSAPAPVVSGYSKPYLCFIVALTFLAGVGVAVLASSAAALVTGGSAGLGLGAAVGYISKSWRPK